MERRAEALNDRHMEALQYAMNVISQSAIAPYVEELYLYGSCAKGTQGWNSDVDLLLVLSTDAAYLKREVIQLKGQVSKDDIYAVDVDLKVAYGQDWKKNTMLYYKNIAREGRKLW